MTEKSSISISDRLKSLGISKGVVDLAAPKKTKAHTIERVLEGRTIENPQGGTYLVEKFFPKGHPLGQSELDITAPLDQLARWAKDERIRNFTPESFAFIDTETTGLSGGTGTYAFLIGAGRFENEEFHLAQFFMRDPAEEPAQLCALEQFLAPCQSIVTFNGKTFDIPLLNARFTAHGWQTPFQDKVHLDLLYLARRLWRDRLSSRTLGNLEVQILGADREDDDIPGWMIPSIYFEYLRDGDARPLKNVIYHNEMDVISMAALLNYMTALLSSPIEFGSRYSVDLISLAKLFEDMNDFQTATILYIHGLEHDDTKEMRLPKLILLKAIQRLALIYKRQKKMMEAIQLWELAAKHQHLESFVELAKCYEHHYKDYPKAIHWTTTAIEVVNNPLPDSEFKPISSAFHRKQWLEELEHRLNRLLKKQKAS
jgi:uncharacterized protein YprB with RNaseH-like and TPR domain